MSNRADWSWKPDALTRKRIKDGNDKVNAAKRRAVLLHTARPRANLRTVKSET